MTSRSPTVYMVFNLPSLKLGRGRRPTGEQESEDSRAEGSSSRRASSKNTKKDKPLTRYEFQQQWKKQRVQEFEPTKAELVTYARSLGIDPMIDADLMWIAEESLFAPLPVDWTEHHDSGDRVFYFNSETRETSWIHPLEAVHREIYKKIRDFREGRLSREEREKAIAALKDTCQDWEVEAEKVLQSVSEHQDEQGQSFWYCDRTRKSSWTDPRPAVCHQAGLNLKALVILHQKEEENGGKDSRGLPAASSQRSGDSRDSPLHALPPMSDRSERHERHRSSKHGRGRSEEREPPPLLEEPELEADDENDAAAEELAKEERRRKKKKKKEREKERASRSVPPPDMHEEFQRTGPIRPDYGAVASGMSGSKSARTEREAAFPPVPGSTPRAPSDYHSPSSPDPISSGRMNSSRHKRPPVLKEEPMPIAVRTPRGGGGGFLSGLPPINGGSDRNSLPSIHGGNRRSMGPGAEGGIRLQPLHSVDAVHGNHTLR